MKTAAASKAGRDGAVELMKIAAAEAAVEAAAGKTGGDGRGAGVEITRSAHAAGAIATKTWTVAESM
jgi:hypothetical protein